MRVNQPADNEPHIDPESTDVASERARQEWQRASKALHDWRNGNQTQPTRQADNERTTVDLCDAYLSTLHVGAWGRMFYITSDNDRRTAAEWLAAQIEGVMANVHESRQSGTGSK